jgi:CheY-like chemotaxis protein
MKQYTIAIIDDDEDDLDILSSAFRESYENAAILTFTSGNAFMEFVQTTTNLPNLAVTDLYMPMIDGLELIAAMKANPRTEDVKVILLSTFLNQPVLAHVAAFKNVNYYLKPNSYTDYVALANKIMKTIYAL